MNIVKKKERRGKGGGVGIGLAGRSSPCKGRLMYIYTYIAEYLKQKPLLERNMKRRIASRKGLGTLQNERMMKLETTC